MALTTSIALCTYNGSQYILEQLQSLASQTILPNEIVIIDDCSTDNTIEIITTFQQNTIIPISIIQNNINLGFVRNFEKAITFCSNDIVFLCDQDDIWINNKIELILELFNQNKEYSLICHNSNLLYNNCINSTLWQSLAFDYYMKHYPISQKKLLERVVVFGNTCSGHAMAFRRKQLQFSFIKNFPNQMPHDYQILLYFLLNGNVFLLNKPLVNYRIHNGQALSIPSDVRQNLINAYKDFYSNPTQHFFRYWSRKHELSPIVKNHILQVDLITFIQTELYQSSSNQALQFIKKILMSQKFDKIIYTLYLRLKKNKSIKTLLKRILFI